MAWCSGNAFDPIGEVTVLRARLVTGMGDWLWASKLSLYVTSRLG